MRLVAEATESDQGQRAYQSVWFGTPLIVENTMALSLEALAATDAVTVAADPTIDPSTSRFSWVNTLCPTGSFVSFR